MLRDFDRSWLARSWPGPRRGGPGSWASFPSGRATATTLRGPSSRKN